MKILQLFYMIRYQIFYEKINNQTGYRYIIEGWRLKVQAISAECFWRVGQFSGLNVLYSDNLLSLFFFLRKQPVLKSFSSVFIGANVSSNIFP